MVRLGIQVLSDEELKTFVKKIIDLYDISINLGKRLRNLIYHDY